MYLRLIIFIPLLTEKFGEPCNSCLSSIGPKKAASKPSHKNALNSNERVLTSGKEVWPCLILCSAAFWFQVDDIEQQKISQDQLVTMGQTQLLYIDVDQFLRLRKVEDKIPRLYLQLELIID